MDEKMILVFEKINEIEKEFLCNHCKIIFGSGVTGEQFITKDGRADIEERFHPMTVDMETGAVAQTAYINKIPFVSIRAITDTPIKTGIGTFLENLELASKNAVLVLEIFLQVINQENK
jgi:adenosylhomocysteine nucleosidase